MTEKINISISKELKQKLEEKIKQTSFESIQEYITCVLEQVVSESSENDETPIYNDEANTKGKSSHDEEDDLLSEMEEVNLKKSLADLGYKV